MAYFHGSRRGGLKVIHPKLDERTGIKGVFLSKETHGPSMHSLFNNAAKHSVNYRTRNGKLAVGRVISKEALRPHGYLYEVKVNKRSLKHAPHGGGAYSLDPVKVVSHQRVKRDKLLNEHNWHHVNTRKLHYRDYKRKRSWVLGQRVHHGAYAWGLAAGGLVAGIRGKPTTAKALGKTAHYLIKDDIKDAPIWFEKGPQWQGAEAMRGKHEKNVFQKTSRRVAEQRSRKTGSRRKRRKS